MFSFTRGDVTHATPVKLKYRGAKSTHIRLHLSGLENRTVPSHQVLTVNQADPQALYHTIQAAVNAAHPGDEIRISSGTYHEAVVVTTPGLTIDGAPSSRHADTFRHKSRCP